MQLEFTLGVPFPVCKTQSMFYATRQRIGAYLVLPLLKGTLPRVRREVLPVKPNILSYATPQLWWCFAEFMVVSLISK